MSVEENENDARMSDWSMREFIDEIVASVDALVTRPNDEESQRRVCLATRAAYTEFYTHAVIDGRFDPATAAELVEQMSRAGEVLAPGPYKNSVNRRFDELTIFVRDSELQCPADTAI